MIDTLTSADGAAITADMAAIINEWPQSIVIRRGSENLPAQTVRVARSVGSTVSRVRDEASDAGQTLMTVLGLPGLDIERGDRFTVDGELYRVTGVHPDTRFMVQARAELMQ